MPLMLSDTIGGTKRRKATTYGGISRKLLRIRMDISNPADCRVETSWAGMFLSLGLTAGDESRMVTAESERDRDALTAKAWLRSYVKGRLADCESVRLVADVGYWLLSASDWRASRDAQRYRDARAAALRKARELLAHIEALPENAD